MPLSVQVYPECILKVLVIKQHGKIQTLVLRIIARKEIPFKSVSTELIDKKRNFENVYLDRNITQVSFPLTISKNKYLDVKIQFAEFKNHLTSLDKPFRTFRFAVENTSGKKYKTHELAFNKNWVIYRPDSGKYN